MRAWRQDEAKPRISKQLSEAKNHYLYLITGELHLETLNVTGPVHIIHHHLLFTFTIYLLMILVHPLMLFPKLVILVCIGWSVLCAVDSLKR